MFYNNDKINKAFVPTNNVRDIDTAINEVKILTRVSSIIAEGLLTPLMVNTKSGRGVRGYIRAAAIQRIYDEQPEEFKRLFPNGISVDEVSVDDQEEKRLMNDHGHSEGLERTEVYKGAKQLFEAMASEADVAIKMGSQLDVFSKNPAILQSKLAKCKTDEEKREVINAHRRGTVQRLHHLFRLPECVETAWLAQERGEDVEYRLTNADVNKLAKAFKADVDLDDSITKVIPGNEFRNKWDAVVKDATAKAKSGNGRNTDKWTQTTVENKGKEFVSDALKRLMKKCSGDTEVSLDGVSEADRRVHVLEILEKHSPDFFAEMWKEAVSEYKGALKDIDIAKNEQASRVA